MMTSKSHYEEIAQALTDHRADDAHQLVRMALAETGENADLYYLQGKAYMKQSDWGNALSSFMRAEELDANSPARECRRMLTDIMDFYNKDMYNH